jgi:pantothenate kinase-related protein Tda10
MALAEECLVMMDFSPRDVSDQLTFMNQKEFTLKQETQKSLSEKDMKMFWNGYKSPEDFYLMCYSMVMGLTKKQFLEIIGEQGKTLEKNVLELYKSLPIV